MQRNALSFWFSKPFVILVILAVGVLTGCRDSPQQKAARFLQSGEKHMEKRDYAAAILEFRNAARLSPQDAEPYYRLGLAFIAVSSPKEAAQALLKATQLNPHHADAQLKVAELMLLSRKEDLLQRAYQRIQGVLAEQPDNSDALFVMASGEALRGDLANAEKYLREALQRHPEHLRSSAALALVRLAQNDLSGAEEILQSAIARSPRSPEPLVALAEVNVLSGRLAKAEPYLRRAIEIAPNNGPALLALSELKIQLGDKASAEQLYRRLSDHSDPTYSQAYASFLLKESRTEEAIKELERLVKQSPRERSIRSNLVAAYFSARRFESARAVLETALKSNPKDIDALLQRAQIHIYFGRHTEAEQDLAKLLQYNRISPQAHYLLAKIRAQRGDPAGERLQLDEALRLNPNLLVARIDLAKALVRSRSARAALQVMDEAPQDQKNLVAAIIQRNWVLLAMGRKADLGKSIQQALAVRRVPEIVFQEGMFKLLNRDYEGARASIREMLAARPENAQALEALAHTYLMQNQATAALDTLRQHAAQHPNIAEIQILLGTWLLDGKALTGARAAFQNAKMLNPNSLPADLGLARVDIAERRNDQARERLSGLLAANSQNVQARLMLALLEESIGNSTAAIAHYRAVLDASPGNVLVLNNLAYLLATTGNSVDEALTYAQKAKELSPNDPVTDDTLGWVFYRKGLYRRAVEHLEIAVKHPSTVPKYHLAMAYLKNGDAKRGKHVLSAALKEDPSLPEAKVAQDEFRRADGAH